MGKEKWMPIVNCGLNAGDNPLCWDGEYFDSEEECQEWIEENGDNFTMTEMAGCVCPTLFSSEEIEYRKIAIINHETHELYIEDIPIKILDEEYNGEEEDYIKDNYDLKEGQYSWDYIVHTEFRPYEDDWNPISVEFEDDLV